MSEPAKAPDGSAARRRRWRRLGVAGVAFAVAGLAVLLLRAPILTAFGRFLVVEDPLIASDAIVLLNGGLDTRPAAAAALYGRGLAPIVVVAREEEGAATRLGLMPNRTDVTVQLLKHGGVPDSAIRELRTPGGSTSTTDEARIFHSYARDHDFARVILVTSDYHTRRSRLAFHRSLDSLDITVLVTPVPGTDFGPADWWTSESGLLAIFEEYVKLIRDALTS
jgi:uncharacterized SAM-binding protein YcdF (DUF218 family)